MKPLVLLLQSSLGRKFIMALSGAALGLFVIGHLAGNLQIFLPKERINAYAHFLHTNPGLLWAARLGLLACTGLHIWAAATLSLENRAARGPGFGTETPPVAASYASRTMLMSGLIVAAFVLYHLLHFTVQVPAVNLTGKDFHALEVTRGAQQGYQDVHAMMVAGFSHPLISGFYLVGVGLLCLHLSHGIGSMFQSLGFCEGVWRGRLNAMARLVALLLFIGYASIPIAVYLRLVQ
jgi:succinate dehydrogenase / fumarate reductase cytochrome b subunit